MLPYRLNGGTLGQVAGQFIVDCAGNMPSSVFIDFSHLGFVEPVGVTFLSNLVFSLNRAGTTAFFINHQRFGDAIRFLDDSLFFEQHTSQKLNQFATPRSTTIPLKWVEHEFSHDWLRSSFLPWLSGSTGLNDASLRPLQTSLSELFNNIQDHAYLNVGSIFIQHYPKLKRVTISMADFGRGIPAAVRSVIRDPRH